MSIVVTVMEEYGGGIVADDLDRPGSPAVGRSEECDIYLALGRWMHNNQDRLEELGLTIAIDPSAVTYEMARRRQELAKR